MAKEISCLCILYMLLALSGSGYVHALKLVNNFNQTLAKGGTNFAAADLRSGLFYDYKLNINTSTNIYKVNVRQHTVAAPKTTKWNRTYSENATSYYPNYIVGKPGSDLYEISIVTVGNDSSIAIRRFNNTSGKITYSLKRSNSSCPVPVSATGVVDPNSGDLFVVAMCRYANQEANYTRNFLFIERINKTGGLVRRRTIRPVYASAAYAAINPVGDRLYIAGYKYDNTSHAGAPFLASYKTRTLAQVSAPTLLQSGKYSVLTSLAVDNDGNPVVSVNAASGADNMLFRFNDNGNQTLANTTTQLGDIKLVAGREALYSCGTEFESEGPVYLTARNSSNLSEIAKVKVPNTGSCRFIQMDKLNVEDQDEVSIAVVDREKPSKLRKYVLI
ncbi:uncharacterized protein SPPG_04654 [Spizellomyces punctatus DAOM BR117]|uniref:Uncharacterized protein n=1 Tax=Spizellomyces punctatus (strain DAOM BR117) TaxID=645134 RepID=A0A0L0HHJ7_SPIPD|nr:uncharacterized protein SPPG_04654 [Spizellomyces punctatus DAOM BR117]KND00330.1 hypothetical protein SPPG_04654 [Spizellomyces punctatus DAOM BR117]|eukprot:XP_016608369.1 hypothetical protein SPPG_04654 [Spizellomyces punctatus DAOM BR117]